MKITVLLDNPFTNDPRVRREVSSLVESGHDVRVYCLGKKGYAKTETIDGAAVFRIFNEQLFDIKKRNYAVQMAKLIQTKELEERSNLEVLHCHDEAMLNIGALIKANNRKVLLVYDSHELFHSFPLLNQSAYMGPWLFLKSYVVRKLQVMREKRNSKLIDYLITVSDSIAEDLKSHFKFNGPATVIRNIPNAVGQTVGKPLLREKFQIPEENAIIVFIAGNLYARGHNLQLAIDQFGNEKNISFIIIGEGKGREIYNRQVNDAGYKNVYFHDKVKASEIMTYLSGCDIGLLPIWNKSSLSYWYALPNKLFEYVMAQIPVLSTIQPEYRKIIEGYDIGVCVNPEEKGAFKKGLDSILQNMENYPEKLEKAKNVLNWDREKTKLTSLYEEIGKKIN